MMIKGSWSQCHKIWKLCLKDSKFKGCDPTKLTYNYNWKISEIELLKQNLLCHSCLLNSTFGGQILIQKEGEK
jgi:hypothetical protein